MKILFGFLPFIAFAVASSLGHTASGLLAGALIAAGTLAWDNLCGRRIKPLEAGTCALFTTLAVYAMISGSELSLGLVRLSVDSGLLLIILGTALMGRPFTMDYARERVSPALWGTPQFRHANQVISLVWAAAFVVFIFADLAMWRHLATASQIVLVNAGALYVAMKFTAWYPTHVRKQV